MIKFGIEYPIIKYIDDNSLNIAITHYYGTDLNEPGNTVLAGHDGYKDLFFDRADLLEIGDVIQIESDSRTEEYIITKSYITDPNNLSVLDKLTDGIDESKTLTLITCSSKGTKRLIIEANQYNKEQKE